MTAPSSRSERRESYSLADLFTRAQELPPEARRAFIEQSCHGDDDVQRELESLLEHAAPGESFFEQLSERIALPERVPILKVGRYEIVSCIGVGGMGAVYRARDTRLEREVALKFLSTHAQAPHGAAEQLLIEARTAASLEHVNVCTVHEIGETEDGRPFIAMALYDGETLRERLRRGPLPAGQAADVARQIARGLGAAHARGIVHRDVKPGNVMLTPDGTVKLLDFGLAQVTDPGATRLGATPGTLAYMSPEQLRGDAVGAASDLWSLGVVLFEMLVGEHPFSGDSEGAVRQAILGEQPVPLFKARPDAPEALQRIVSRLLQKEAAERYSSASDLLTDLDRVLAAPDTSSTSPRDRGSVKWRRALLAAGAVLTIMAAIGSLWRQGWLAGAAPAGEVRTIAVLPFTNVSREPEEEYLSDGLTEELIAALSRVRALRVVARTSAFAFKDEARDVREIGRALNVSTVLEGSVQRVGERFRVTVKLTNTADGSRLSSWTYDRELAGVLAIQPDLVTRIAAALEAEPTTAERQRLARRPTTSHEAFTLYLKGRHFWHQRTRASYERAVEYFKRALAIDPGYAAAHAGLAAVYSQQGMIRALSAEEASRRTLQSARRALEIDAGFAEAHSMLGVHLHAHDWNAAAAEREHVLAVALGPGNPTTHFLYGNFLRSTGRVEEAIVHHSRAVELDPLAPASSETLAFTLLRAGRVQDAYARVSEAIELDSTYWRARAVLGLIHELAGRPQDALRELERANTLAGTSNHRTSADIARVLARTGQTREARQLVAMLQSSATGTVDVYVATALIALGDADGAHAWLERAYRERSPHLPFLGGDPRFTPFDADPRFIDMMRRVGVRRADWISSPDPRPER